MAAAGSALERALRASVHGDVLFDAGSRAAYSTDASNYRHLPIGVACPRSVEDAVAAVRVGRAHGAPLLVRGGGTSLAGQAANEAVVVDMSRYCTRLVSVDLERRTCVVEPGIVLDDLNRQLAPYGLEFGPRPATHGQCTVGGMIGNDSCGASAQRTGTTAANIARLDVLLYDGTRMWVGPTTDAEFAEIQRAGGRRAEIYQALRDVRDRHLAAIRTGVPRIPRPVSGYRVGALLPEEGFDVGRALVGSEGTLVTVLRAELRLVPVLAATALVIVRFPDIAAAADGVPAVLRSEPTALEGIDERIVEFAERRGGGGAAVAMFPRPALPRAGRAPYGYLLIQAGGEDHADVATRTDRIVQTLGDVGPADIAVVSDPLVQQQVWRLRDAGLAAAADIAGAPPMWPGWEDAAVGPDRLGAYLRDFHALLAQHGFADALVYGHFGHGCVHCRLPFVFGNTAGVAAYRAFVTAAAELVVRYGGSLSGEHGDGQARGELLPLMFSPEMIGVFRALKTIFDPDGRMNPGRLVDPAPLDADLRLVALAPAPDRVSRTHFAYGADGGRFDTAVHRCVGIGDCRRPTPGGATVMCPSYQVTRDERYTTRGRARLLAEMVAEPPDARAGPITGGWRSEAVRDALDLCLACKGCLTDCPAGVDMATYKAEFLAHHYERRLRPAAHYSMGWLPVWARLAALAPRAVNTLARAPGVAGVAKWAAGIDDHRELPHVATTSLRQWFRRRTPGGHGARGGVVLWPDTFTTYFAPEIAMAAVAVLEDAGWRVTLPEGPVCCGLTWISTGQLDIAKRVLARSVSTLAAYVRTGVPVVGLEPSCTAVFRGDATELLPPSSGAADVRDSTYTFAELLVDHTPGWSSPRVNATAVVQPHCHQHAVMGFAADERLLATAAVTTTTVGGCCGLAGDFGFARGHYDLSVACAEQQLLPAVRGSPDAVVLADGFSCRTQVAGTTDRRAIHVAELLAAALPPATARSFNGASKRRA